MRTQHGLPTSSVRSRPQCPVRIQPLRLARPSLLVRSTGKLRDQRSKPATAGGTRSNTQQQHYCHPLTLRSDVPGVPCPLTTGAAGDAAKDFLNNVSQQADAVKDSVNKQADAVKQSAAAAVEDLKSQVGQLLLLDAAINRQ